MFRARRLVLAHFWVAFVGFNLTLGGEKKPELPAVDVWAGSAEVPGLQSAIAAPGNWTALMPPNGYQAVSLRETDASSASRVDPLGTAKFEQKVLPFKLAISKFAGRDRAKNDAVTVLLMRHGRFAPVFALIAMPMFARAMPALSDRALGKPAMFLERPEGVFELRRGFRLDRGTKILMVEDVVTTGLSSIEAIDSKGEPSSGVFRLATKGAMLIATLGATAASSRAKRTSSSMSALVSPGSPSSMYSFSRRSLWSRHSSAARSRCFSLVLRSMKVRIRSDAPSAAVVSV